MNSKPISSPKIIHSVLQFWFGTATESLTIAAEKSALWWAKNEATDKYIRDHFGELTAAAGRGELTEWTHTPLGMLAVIICTDQFPRNIYRATKLAFSSDKIALQLAAQCIDSGAINALSPIQKVFAYLPFEHSEQLSDQVKSVDLYQALAAKIAAESTYQTPAAKPNNTKLPNPVTTPTTETELFNTYLKFARQHHLIIQQFGRFPHRNAILGRQSTAAELAFLQQPNSSF